MPNSLDNTENISQSRPIPYLTREGVQVGLILFAALTVRLAYLAQWAANPLFHSPMGDELSFHQMALSLLGENKSQDVFLYQPLYSFFLAGVYGVFGTDIGLVRIVQLVIGVGNCLLFYGLGRELGGAGKGRPVGKISALLLALYGPQVFFEGNLLAPVLTVPLTAGALWALLAAVKRARIWLLLPAGLLMGLAMMGRPNLGACVVVAGIWLLTRPWPLKRRLYSAGMALAAVLAGLSPSWIHNALRGEGKMPVSSSAGINFYLGNNPQATGAFHIPSGERFTGSTHRDFKTNMVVLAEQAEGRKLNSSEVSAHWYGRGLEFWSEQPLAALRLTGKKLLLSLNGEEIPVHHPYMFAREVVGLLKFLLSFAVIFPFALLGLVTGPRRSGGALLICCAGAYLLTLLTFFVADRFRIVMLPMLVPLAGLGMAGLYQRFSATGTRSRIYAVAILAAAFGMTQIPMLPEAYRARAIARGFNNMGKAEGERGKLSQAEAHFRKAVELAGWDPKSHARVNLGRVLELKGDLPGAREMYLEAARIGQENRYPRLHLARLAEQAGDINEAIKWWEEVASLMADPAHARRQIERLRALIQPEVP